MKEEKHLMDTPIAGTQHHTTRDQLERLSDGIELQLVREKDNEFDAHAVRVDFSGKKLGYIPRSHSMVFASLLDGGYEIRAVTEEVVPRKGLINIRLSILRDKQ